MNQDDTAPAAVVTGATRGLGFEVARQLIAAGWRVAIGGRGSDRIRDAATRLGIGDCGYDLDVGDPRSVRSFCDAVSTRFRSIALLINNAGVYLDPDKTILDVANETVIEAFRTNAAGALSVAQAFLPAMIEARRGTIVNVSSQNGQLTSMGFDNPSYRLSKLALNGITVMLSHAVCDYGIRVNSVCPGWCSTDMGGTAAPRSVRDGAADIVWVGTNRSSVSGKFFIGREEANW